MSPENGTCIGNVPPSFVALRPNSIGLAVHLSSHVNVDHTKPGCPGKTTASAITPRGEVASRFASTTPMICMRDLALPFVIDRMAQ